MKAAGPFLCSDSMTWALNWNHLSRKWLDTGRGSVAGTTLPFWKWRRLCSPPLWMGHIITWLLKSELAVLRKIKQTDVNTLKMNFTDKATHVDYTRVNEFKFHIMWITLTLAVTLSSAFSCLWWSLLSLLTSETFTLHNSKIFLGSIVWAVFPASIAFHQSALRLGGTATVPPTAFGWHCWCVCVCRGGLCLFL